MSLNQAVKAAFKAAKRVGGDMFHNVTYYQSGLGVYDTDSGTQTFPDSKTANIKMLVALYSDKEVDGEIIRPTDKKGMLEASAMTIIPDLMDNITDAGLLWTVVGVEKDPTQTVYLLQLRQP